MKLPMYIPGFSASMISEATKLKLNWTYNKLSENATTKEDFNNLVIDTFGSDLIANNISSSTYYNVHTDTYPLAITIGSTPRQSSKVSNPRNILAAISTPVFSAKVKKPKRIIMNALWYNDAVGFFGLRFKGLTSNQVYIPIGWYDQGYGSGEISYGGMFINHCNSKLKSISTGNNIYELDLDMATQCSSCFTNTTDEYYQLDYISVTTYVGANSSTVCKPLCIKDLIIEY